MALSGAQKTAVTLVETNINAALLGLDLKDQHQFNTHVVLRHMRKRLELIKVERTL